MLVFKFGGASVKDADAVRNVAKIIELYTGQQLIVVISAMGKTTNALETIVRALRDKDQPLFEETVRTIEEYHLAIAAELFSENNAAISEKIMGIFKSLRDKSGQPFSSNYDFEYDQIVSLGEVLSTLIVNAYLQSILLPSAWADIRNVIRTDHQYRDGNVDWDTTEELVKTNILPLFTNAQIIITQGFLGHTPENFTTTLGREGSDYTAAILAYCCHADSVTIWKDVPGMLNADPKYFKDTVKLDQISFKEAIELSYYGASIIHPKTIKPLQNKSIPLYVKSFQDPEAEGTVIQDDMNKDGMVPSYIFKVKQVLFSIMPKDFSFIVEKNLSSIFELLAKTGVKINLMQNSALSFSFIVDGEKVEISRILKLFQKEYEIKFNDQLELITIRHYDQQTIEKVTENKKIILEQRDRQTVRLVVY